MEFFLQLFAQGIVVGLVYALVGQGLNVTFWTMRVVNFAHGSLMMIAVFVELSAFNRGLPVLPALLVAVLVVGLLGILLERIAIRPVVRRPSGLGWIVATIGAAIVLQETATILYGPQARAAPDIVFGPVDFLQLGEVSISLQLLLAAAVAVVVLLAFQIVLRFTAWGAVLRATSYDRDLALLQGVRVQAVISASFFISAALAGIAGMLLAPVTGISPSFGFSLMLSGFTAIVVGGVGSSLGALFGGLTVGVTELLVGGYIGSQSQHMIVLVVLIAILMFRPTGLFGTQRAVKV